MPSSWAKGVPGCFPAYGCCLSLRTLDAYATAYGFSGFVAYASHPICAGLEVGAYGKGAYIYKPPYATHLLPKQGAGLGGFWDFKIECRRTHVAGFFVPAS